MKVTNRDLIFHGPSAENQISISSSADRVILFSPSIFFLRGENKSNPRENMKPTSIEKFFLMERAFCFVLFFFARAHCFKRNPQKKTFRPKCIDYEEIIAGIFPRHLAMTRTVRITAVTSSVSCAGHRGSLLTSRNTPLQPSPRPLD